MNKTTITTIILDAAILLAVTLFMFVIRPWDKADKKDQADYAPVPELTIAEQEGIEPVEGIRITAQFDFAVALSTTSINQTSWELVDDQE